MRPAADARISTGVRGLDQILAGGLPPRRMYLIEGGPGVGKTTLSMQFLLEGARRGERTLYVSLSESREELGAVAASHGWDLDGIDIYDMSSASSQELHEADNTLYVPSEIELGERMERLLAEVDRVKPARIVVDSVSELRLLAERPLRFRRQILALKEELVRRNCTILLLENPMQPEGDVLLQSLVHGVIFLEQLSPGYGVARRRLRVMKLRGVQFRGGHHDYGIEPGGLQVFPRLVAAEHRDTVDETLFPTGIDGLDALLGGGMNRGTSTLLLGPSGSGKSALATACAVATAERGERAALYVFDEGLSSLLGRSRGLGLPLEEHVDAGRITVRQIDPAELPPGAFIHGVRDAVDNHDVRLVVIDTLNGFITSMPEDRFLIVHLHELLSYLRQQGVAVLLVEAEHGAPGACTHSGFDVTYVADCVVLLRLFEANGRVHKAISVVKKRAGPHENAIRQLSIGPDGIGVGPPLEDFRGVLTGVPIFTGDKSASGPLGGKNG